MKPRSLYFAFFLCAGAFTWADVPGGKDPEGVKRYEGSELIGYRAPLVDEFDLPLSVPTDLSPPKYERVRHLVGRVSRHTYLAPNGVSGAALYLNYQREFERLGLDTLFSKRPSEKGWFGPTFGKMEEEDGLSQMLEYNEDEERVLVAKSKDETPTYYYLFVTTYKDGLRGKWEDKVRKGQALAVLQIVAPESVAQKMVFVKAEEMARQIKDKGSVALYGLYFDTDRDTLRAESEPTLKEIAKLLKADPSLKVHVVGHTDNVGKADYNLDLSKRRAASVAKTLAQTHGISATRLDAFGCGLYAPVASNDSEAGKAKNRRVELVNW